MKYNYLISLLLMQLIASSVFAQTPVSKHNGVQITDFLSTNAQCVRVAIDKSTDRMFYTTFDGKIFEITGWKENAPSAIQLATANDHGIITQMGGMTIQNNIMYLAGSTDQTSDANAVGIIKKTNVSQSPLVFTVVGYTAPYPKSNTAFDHRFNNVEIDPTGKWLFINSGSKSDHGEEKNGLREVPMTARILRIPINSVNLQLQNDSSQIEPYTYCKGTRNSFGFAWDQEKNMFATENSGDRDHPEELNWLRQGFHYGFPWTMGGIDNPQQFANYAPGSFPNTPADKYIQGSSYAYYLGLFKNDPTFPPKPQNYSTGKPVINLGPDADYYRDSISFNIRDASTLAGASISTFSPHLSPAGITFDTDYMLGSTFSGGALVVNFNEGGLLSPFDTDGSGGGLMYMQLSYDSLIDNYKANTHVIATSMGAVSDIEIYNNVAFVTSFDRSKIYKVILPSHIYNRYKAPESRSRPVIDGMANEYDWQNAPWRGINHLFVDNMPGSNANTKPTPADLNGRYKIMWKGNELYILAEITDDTLKYINNPSNPGDVFGGDAMEIFIDENKSGGAHTKTHNAFAYHINPQGKVADQCGCGNANDYSGNSGDWNARFFNDVLESKVIKNGNKYTWEMALKVYNDTYTDGGSNASKLVNLTAGKILGFGLGYNDYDLQAGQRDHLLGSFSIPGNNNGDYNTAGGRNVGWQNASAFGELELTGGVCPPIAMTMPGIYIDTDQNPANYTAMPTVKYPYSDLTFSLSTVTSYIGTLSVNSSTGIVSVLSVSGHGGTISQITASNGCNSVSKSFVITSCGIPFFSLPDTANINTDTPQTVILQVQKKYMDMNVVYSVNPTVTDFSTLNIDVNGALYIVPKPGKSGIALVTVTAVNECKSFGKQIEFKAPLIESIEGIFLQSIEIYPNPVLDGFMIKALNPGGKYKIDIQDFTGRIIKTLTTDSDTKVSLQDLAAGVYGVVVRGSTGSKFIRIIKQ